MPVSTFKMRLTGADYSNIIAPKLPLDDSYLGYSLHVI